MRQIVVVSNCTLLSHASHAATVTASMPAPPLTAEGGTIQCLIVGNMLEEGLCLGRCFMLRAAHAAQAFSCHATAVCLQSMRSTRAAAACEVCPRAAASTTSPFFLGNEEQE